MLAPELEDPKWVFRLTPEPCNIAEHRVHPCPVVALRMPTPVEVVHLVLYGCAFNFHGERVVQA